MSGKGGWNKGKWKNPLGSTFTKVKVPCVGCGAKFETLVRNINRGGGRFCSKTCNPKYPKKSDKPLTVGKRHRIKKYGLSVEDFYALLYAQRGACAICGDRASGKGPSGRRLNIDHCHKTGKVRGLLCVSCNRALGWFRDNPELLRKAIVYLGLAVSNQEKNDAS